MKEPHLDGLCRQQPESQQVFSDLPPAHVCKGVKARSSSLKSVVLMILSKLAFGATPTSQISTR